MKTLLSKRRFELAGLVVALIVAALHQWVEKTPVAGSGRLLEAGESVGLAQSVLRGFHILEGRLTDIQFRLRGPRAPHPDVLVVEIDERSAKRYGLWPWSRALVARGIRNLHEAGAAAVGLDITFTDEVPDAAGRALDRAVEELERAAEGLDPAQATVAASYRRRIEALRGPSPDEVLAEALRAAPEVVQGVVMYNEPSLEDFGPERAARHLQDIQPFLIPHLSGPTPGHLLTNVPLDQVAMLEFHSVETPLPPFARASPRVGYFNVVPDPDGTLRRMPPFAYLGAARGMLTALEVQVAAAWLDAKPEIVFDKNLGQVGAIRLRGRKGEAHIQLPVGEPYALINHLGTRDVFPTLSFADVVDNAFDPASVKGKAILIGVTQVGNFDQRVTPFSEFEPGVFLHASFLSNILDGSFLQRPWHTRALELGFIFGAALLLAFVLPRVAFRWKLLVIAAALGGWLLFDQIMFVRGVQIATLLPASNVLVTSFVVIFLGYLSADTERQNLAKAFQYRVGRKVMQEMIAHPEKFKQGGERKELTVLFSDIRGFTSIAERMSPDELSKFINEYLTPMTDIVFETDGTLDKYIGDAVMAFWGAPVDQPDHAARACTAALKMLEKLEALKQQWRQMGRPDFDIGVGINTGPMSVGFMGSQIRGDYTVMGDAVNLASRLEGTNKEYETRVLISEGTWAQVHTQFVTRRLGAVRVKGKRRPVRIYELRGFGQPEGPEAEAISHFESALDLYAERRFGEAEAALRRVLEIWPGDPPSERYLEEIAAFKVNPPGPGWDGVYTATTK